MNQPEGQELLGPDQPGPAPSRAVSITGPADRVSFLDEQQGRRRQSRLLSAVCVLAAMIMSIPLSMLITPPLYLLVVLIAKGVSAVIGLPDTIWAFLRNWAAVVPDLIESIAEPEKARHLVTRGMLLWVLMLLAPGMVGMFLMWSALKSRFADSGLSALLLSLGGRATNSAELEERQLVNVVEEMALAAGVQPPEVRILGCDAPCAAVVGTSPDNTRLLVSRKLLESMNRDETQGIVAHLTASAGNGDPQVAMTVLGVSQMLGLLFTTLDALLGGSRSAWREWKLALGWLSGKRLEPEAEAFLLESLAGGMRRFRDDGLFDDEGGGIGSDRRPSDAASGDAFAGPGARVARFFLWPLRVLQIVGWMIRAEVMLLTAFLVGPIVMFILRSRRCLADACAVQLTRNPDGLARALALLDGQTEPLPGGGWADHLFAVGSRAEAGMRGFSGQLGGFVSPHPPLRRRINRLEAQGANPRFEPLKRALSWRNPGNLLVVLVVAPLALLAVWFLLVAVGLAFSLALGFALFYQGILFALVRLVLL